MSILCSVCIAYQYYAFFLHLLTIDACEIGMDNKFNDNILSRFHSYRYPFISVLFFLSFLLHYIVFYQWIFIFFSARLTVVHVFILSPTNLICIFWDLFLSRKFLQIDTNDLLTFERCNVCRMIMMTMKCMKLDLTKWSPIS